MKNLEEHADLLYSVYCEAVGGVAFNGDPLPAWQDFAADPKKQLQSDAWRSVAKQSLELEAALDTARELHQCEVNNVRNLMHYATGSPGHVALSGYAVEVRDAIYTLIRERDEARKEATSWRDGWATSHVPLPWENVPDALASESKRKAAETADGKPDGQAENDPALATRGLEPAPENHAGDGQPSGLPAAHGSAS